MPGSIAPAATDALGSPVSAPAQGGVLGTPGPAAPAAAPAAIAPEGGTMGGGTTASAAPNLAALASIHAALHAATAPPAGPPTLTAVAGSVPVPTGSTQGAAPLSAVHSALSASLAPQGNVGGVSNATPAQAASLVGQNLPVHSEAPVAGAQPLAQNAVNQLGNQDLVNYGTTGTTNPFIAGHNASQADAKQMLQILATQGSAAAQAYADGKAQVGASKAAAVKSALSSATLRNAAPGEANNVESMASLPGNLFSNYLTQGAASAAQENKAQTSAYNQYGQEVSQAVPVIQAQTQATTQSYQNKAEAGLAAAVQTAALKAQEEQATIAAAQYRAQAAGSAAQGAGYNAQGDQYKLQGTQATASAAIAKANAVIAGVSGTGAGLTTAGQDAVTAYNSGQPLTVKDPRSTTAAPLSPLNVTGLVNSQINAFLGTLGSGQAPVTGPQMYNQIVTNLGTQGIVVGSNQAIKGTIAAAVANYVDQVNSPGSAAVGGNNPNALNSLSEQAQVLYGANPTAAQNAASRASFSASLGLNGK